VGRVIRDEVLQNLAGKSTKSIVVPQSGDRISAEPAVGVLVGKSEPSVYVKLAALIVKMVTVRY
jgi:hypothetical protein